MATDHRHVTRHVRQLLKHRSEEELAQQLVPRAEDPAPKVPGGPHLTAESVERRWELVHVSAEAREQVLDPQTRAQLTAYQNNIENFVGTVKLPVGLAGPLRVNGLHARGDYYIPLATSEAALVASYSRGCQVISEAGGCTAVLLNEGVTRAPGFAFRNLGECGRFLAWATAHLDEFRKVAEATTRFGKLLDMRVTVEGNHVYLGFEYTTGDASGQNMVTIATNAVCDYILANSPVPAQYSFLEANMSGDKKASAQSFVMVRGKKVSAEATVPADLIRRRLNTDPRQIVRYWTMCAVGGVLSGTMGVHAHYANGLAALFIACGQDAACVAEAAVGVTRCEVLESGDLYGCVTLPNLIVGTVGGGTGLPSQNACLEMLGLSGPGNAAALAEICAGLCLAGELSIAAAFCAGDFSRAHRVLARARKARQSRKGAKPDEGK